MHRGRYDSSASGSFREASLQRWLSDGESEESSVAARSGAAGCACPFHTRAARIADARHLLDGAFGSSDDNADFNGDGVVDFFDLSIMDGRFGQAPGPPYIDTFAGSNLTSETMFDANGLPGFDGAHAAEGQLVM